MTDNNQDQRFRGSENGELDRQLDAALAKYAAVEPRAGLEERVLANLRAERTRVPRTWWHWGLAGALAAVVVVALALAWKSGKPSLQPVVQHPSTVQPSPIVPQTPAVAQNEDSRPAVQRIRPSRASGVHNPRPAVVAKANPKLDVFPSPQPLSEQELALSRYVRDFPQEAVLVAQSQAEAEIEMQMKMGRTEPTSSEQQER